MRGFSIQRGRRFVPAVAAAVCCCLASVFAQTAPLTVEEEYALRRWGVEDGLPEASVVALERMPDGFLWLVTPQNIVRFDGVRFETLREDQWPARSLSALRGLCLDQKGVLWVYGAGGALRYQDGVWSNLLGAASAKPDIIVHLVRELPDGTVVAVSNKGVHRLGGAEGGAFWPVPQGGGASAEILAAAADGNGVVWLAAGDRLLAFESGRYRDELFAVCWTAGWLLYRLQAGRRSVGVPTLVGTSPVASARPVHQREARLRNCRWIGLKTRPTCVGRSV